MKVINIIIKDLKILLSDKKALVIILIMPLVLMVILSFALKGTFISGDGINNERINIAIVKQYDINKDTQRFVNTLSNGFFDQGTGVMEATVDPEKIFIEDFLGNEDVKKIITFQFEEENRAIEMLDNGEVSAVVLLPESFIYDMKINLLTPFRNKVDIKVLTHPDKSISGQVVQAIVEAFSNSMSSVIIGKNVLIETALTHDLGNQGFKDMEEVMDGISKAMEGIQINMEDYKVEGRKQISSADYYAVAMLTMFILFAASHGGRMLLEEKENITYQRMIIAGTSTLGILAGKFFTIFLIAILQITIMITFSYFALKVQWGDVVSIILISFTAAIAVAGIGSAIAVITYKAGNYKIANIFETLIIQTMALLGGSFFPIDIMPSIIQKLSVLSLNGLALKAYQKIMMGYGITDIINHITILAGIGVLFALASVLILRGEGEFRDAQYHKVKIIKA